MKRTDWVKIKLSLSGVSPALAGVTDASVCSGSLRVAAVFADRLLEK